jgi:hypothetical protein
MRDALDLARRRRSVGTFFDTGLRRAFDMKVLVRLTVTNEPRALAICRLVHALLGCIRRSA